MDANRPGRRVLGIAGVAGIALGLRFAISVPRTTWAGRATQRNANPFAIGDQVEVGAFTGKVHAGLPSPGIIGTDEPETATICA